MSLFRASSPLIDSEGIDMVGMSGRTLELANLSSFEYGNNIPYLSALAPVTSRFISQSADAVANGYGIGVYEHKSFGSDYDLGLYQMNTEGWVKREEGFLNGAPIREGNYYGK